MQHHYGLSLEYENLCSVATGISALLGMNLSDVALVIIWHGGPEAKRDKF